jgi:hypothetical protein
MKIELILFWGGTKFFVQNAGCQGFCTSFYVGLRKQIAGLRIDEFFLDGGHLTRDVHR